MNPSNHRHRAGWSWLWNSIGIACCIGTLLAGCSRNSTSERTEPTPPRLSDTDVARVGDTAISRQTFEQEWNRRTDVRSKEELLREMIRFESLLAKARAAGMDRDPGVVTAFNRMVVGRFQEDQLRRRGVDSIQVSDPEVQAFYERHSDRFTTPAQVRLGIVVCKTSAKATPEKREQLRQDAAALWNQAKAASDDGFRQLAVQHSDDQATRYAGGDTGWFVPGQTVSRWEPEIIKAASALAKPGDVAPLVETESGFYIVKLLDVQSPSKRPLAEIRDGIEYKLRMEKGQELRQKFFEEMQAGLPIEVNRVTLADVPDHVMQTATSQPPSLPKQSHAIHEP